MKRNEMIQNIDKYIEFYQAILLDLEREKNSILDSKFEMPDSMSDQINEIISDEHTINNESEVLCYLYDKGTLDVIYTFTGMPFYSRRIKIDHSLILSEVRNESLDKLLKK